MIPLLFRLMPFFIAAQTVHAAEIDPFDAIDAEFQVSFEAIDSALSDEYDAINAAIERGYRKLSQEIGSVWGQDEIRLPEKHIWVDYSNDKSIRRIFDFSSQTLTVEHLVDPSASLQSTSARIKEAVYAAKTDTTTDLEAKDEALKYAIDALEERGITLPTSNAPDTFAREPVLGDNLVISEQTVDAIDAIVKEQSTSAVPTQLAADSAQHAARAPSQQDAPRITAGGKQSTQLSSEFTDQGKRKISVRIPLKPDFLLTRSNRFRATVLEQANRHDLQPSLVFAVMETESHFNPRAKSPIPAFGLMQLVPSTGGVDSYNFLYGRKKILPPEYFFHADQNIELGAAYLKLLNQNYLKPIKNPVSRLYCTVAAYNAGPGGVARAFVGNKNVRKASRVINDMNPAEVYEHLITYLPAQETRNYVKKVFKAQERYRHADLAR